MKDCKQIDLDFKYSWKDRIIEFFWPLIRFYKTVARSLAFARIGWGNYDWDSGYLLELMIFKMKRMEKSCFEEGHHIVEKETVKSIRIAIKLAEKIVADNYHRNYKLHEEKWGELKFFDVVEDDRTYTTMGRDILPEQKEQEHREFVIAVEKDRAIRERDKKWFYNILRDWSESWWD